MFVLSPLVSSGTSSSTKEALDTYKVLIGKPEKKIPPGKPRRN
jgi:hypothetical protein